MFPGGPDRFPSTRPSLLRDAASGQAPQALASVAELYWKPVYKHLRLKWRLPDEEAADLTQTAFAVLLEQEWLAKFDPARGSFRAYLRTCVDRLALDGHAAQLRVKRGAGARHVSLDFAAVEREVALADPAPAPDEIFEREWQREIFALAVEDLRRLSEANRCAERFAIFAAHDLAPDQRPTYDQLAADFSLRVTQITNHLAWARRELKRLALERIHATAGSAAEARADARRLFGP